MITCEAVCECDATYSGPRYDGEAMVQKTCAKNIVLLFSIAVSGRECGWFDICFGDSSGGLFSSEEMTWNASQALLSASQVLVDAAISGRLTDQITLIMDTVEDCCDPGAVKKSLDGTELHPLPS